VVVVLGLLEGFVFTIGFDCGVGVLCGCTTVSGSLGAVQILSFL
jgi:hypothetical protein